MYIPQNGIHVTRQHCTVQKVRPGCRPLPVSLCTQFDQLDRLMTAKCSQSFCNIHTLSVFQLCVQTVGEAHFPFQPRSNGSQTYTRLAPRGQGQGYESSGVPPTYGQTRVRAGVEPKISLMNPPERTCQLIWDEKGRRDCTVHLIEFGKYGTILKMGPVNSQC